MFWKFHILVRVFIASEPVCRQELLDCYLSLPILQKPNVRQLCEQTGFGRNQVEHMVNVCLRAKAMEGEAESAGLEFSGPCEGDGHAVKKTVVGRSNPHFQAELGEVLQKKGKRGEKLATCKALALHFRVCKLAVRWLERKPVHPRPPPPTEGIQELQQRGILQVLKKPKSRSQKKVKLYRNRQLQLCFM